MSGQDNSSLTKEYAEFLENLKAQVASSRYRAVRAVNTELIKLYHHIGTEILRKQSEQGWGSKVIDKLSKDLLIAFPDMKGFGVANLHNMRRFAELYSDFSILQQLAGELPWYHHVLLMERVKEPVERLFYIQSAVKWGWSRAMLMNQIEQNLFKRQGNAVTNFQTKLPSAQSNLANSALKDPYIFDFLSLGKDAHEREIEKGLIIHIEKFLLELGGGFAFVGRQYPLKVSTKDYFLDLLFYHLKLRCFVVIELKAVEFEPEHAGKMNFYLSAVDDILKHPTDNPSIGLILCKTKDQILAEYALRDMSKPIGLAEYRIAESLPENIKTELPTIEELEAELSKRVAAEEETKEISLGSNQFTAESENSATFENVSVTSGKGGGSEAVTFGGGNSSAAGLPVSQGENPPSHINPQRGNNRGKGGAKTIPVSEKNSVPSGGSEAEKVPVSVSNSDARGDSSAEHSNQKAQQGNGSNNLDASATKKPTEVNLSNLQKAERKNK